MPRITTARSLQNAISELEKQRIDQEQEIKEIWSLFEESVRPINIIKRSFRDVFPKGQGKPNLLGSAIGLGTGILSKKLFLGKSVNPVKNLVGTAIQLGVSSVLSKNAVRIKSGIGSFFKKIFSRKKQNG